MIRAANRSPASDCHALLVHAPDDVFAWRGVHPVAAREFLADAARIAAALPPASHVLNLCEDRYRFTLFFIAAVMRGQVTLLPPGTNAGVMRSLRAFAPDACYVADEANEAIGLPRFEPDAAAAILPFASIPADQVVACLFTSGSTGEPQPNFKTWGSLVADARAQARRVGARAGDTVLGTVPAQHMYGFESTVMLPLQSGAAMTAERPYFPAEIDAAIARVPARRLLFITPFHLKAWLGAGEPARVETIVSATAPLSVELAREAEARTGARLIEIYGCTEAGQIATRRTAAGEEWRLHDGMRLREQAGRVVVSGGHVEEPTVLQDLIEIRGDGCHFALRGRLADMVNIAGKRSSLAHLNHQLGSIPGVVDGVFHAPEEREPDGVTRLIAFVVAPTLDARRVIAALRERIDPAFLPRPVVMVESLPRDNTGKITRDALAALAQRARR
jgi:acyl-coenzyme A synthetase/AMP-(fatty) acid ligase